MSSGEDSARDGPLDYAVTATFPSKEVMDEYTEWLKDGHLDAVVEGGADRGEMVILDGDTLSVVSRYRFKNRAAFDTYVKDIAPALRADGVKRFGSSGVTFSRTIGIISWAKESS